MPDTTRGQITLAELGVKMDYMARQLTELTGKVDAIKSCQDKWDHIPADVEDLKKTVDEQGTDLTAIKARSEGIGVLNGILSIIAGAVGSLFNPKI